MKTKVENKIRELVPELQSKAKYIIHVGEKNTTIYKDEYRIAGVKLSPDSRPVKQITESNFPKIHLEHVLRAMRPETEDGIEIINVTLEKKLFELYDPYSSFSEQSDELYQFLGEVLGV